MHTLVRNALGVPAYLQLDFGRDLLDTVQLTAGRALQVLQPLPQPPPSHAQLSSGLPPPIRLLLDVLVAELPVGLLAAGRQPELTCDIKVGCWRVYVCAMKWLVLSMGLCHNMITRCCFLSWTVFQDMCVCVMVLHGRVYCASCHNVSGQGWQLLCTAPRTCLLPTRHPGAPPAQVIGLVANKLSKESWGMATRAVSLKDLGEAQGGSGSAPGVLHASWQERYVISLPPEMVGQLLTPAPGDNPYAGTALQLEMELVDGTGNGGMGQKLGTAQVGPGPGACQHATA